MSLHVFSIFVLLLSINTIILIDDTKEQSIKKSDKMDFITIKIFCSQKKSLRERKNYILGEGINKSYTL